MLEETQLDDLLQLQLAVAWAGEANTEPPRLGWWRTALCDEYAGEDLLKRLAPKTWPWAALEATRAAARRVDAAARERAEDADHLVSLFRFNFELDERLDDRVLELKHAGRPPIEALPRLGELLGHAWSEPAFAAWVGAHGSAPFTATPSGRRLRGGVPDDPLAAAARLTAALLPLERGTYPAPHFRLRR